MKWIIIAVIVTIAIAGALLVRRAEKKSWNKGVCPKCGGKWICFDYCFCGDRGYYCNKCGNHIWISYDVDK